MIVKKALVVLLLFLSLSVYSNEMKGCLTWDNKNSEHRPTEFTPSVTNSCSTDLEIFWCLHSDEKKWARRKCGGKEYYHGRTHLSPGEVYHNRFTFPEGVDISYGACAGKYNTRENSGGEDYSCKVNLKKQLESCKKDIDNCSVEESTNKPFNILCKSGDKVLGDIYTELHGEIIVIKIRSGNGITTTSSTQAELSQKIKLKVQSLCPSGIDYSVANQMQRYIRNEVFNSLLNSEAEKLKECKNKSKNKQQQDECFTIYVKKRSVAVGVRG